LIDQGRLLAVETPASLARLISEHERVDFVHNDFGLIDVVMRMPGVSSVVKLLNCVDTHRVEFTNAAGLRPVLEFLVASGVRQLATSRPSLDEVYVNVIGDRGLKV
jgi:ABC-2 type transport system ATP-binding protein